MKLIIQIPCFNEAHTLPLVIAGLPRRVPGFDCVETLVVDDGSSDGTADVARFLGVDHVVRHRRNRGLARAFRTGLERCLRLGADVIVNTDGDNQYAGECVADLVAPILRGEADIVVGDRRTDAVQGFSWRKKLLQRAGSRIVARLSGLPLPDAVSGFRAFSREAALMVNIVTTFSYTTEMIIQAGHKGLCVVAVPIRTNPVLRKSRLFRSTRQFIERSATTMVRTYVMHNPLRSFLILGAILGTTGTVPILRFLWLWAAGRGSGHVQSLVLGGVLIVLAFVATLAGVLADLVGVNRALLELTLEAVRRKEVGHAPTSAQTVRLNANVTPVKDPSSRRSVG